MGNHTATILWLRNVFGWKLDQFLFQLAINSGSLDVADMFVTYDEWKVEWCIDSMTYACDIGHTRTMNRLKHYGCPNHPNYANTASLRGLIWLENNGYPIDYEAALLAQSTLLDNAVCIEWLTNKATLGQ